MNSECLLLLLLLPSSSIDERGSMQESNVLRREVGLISWSTPTGQRDMTTIRRLDVVVWVTSWHNTNNTNGLGDVAFKLKSMEWVASVVCVCVCLCLCLIPQANNRVWSKRMITIDCQSVASHVNDVGDHCLGSQRFVHSGSLVQVLRYWGKTKTTQNIELHDKKKERTRE